ncbi:MAG: hypothetical protein K2K26_12600 [Muribaculaceae bacterium]|nr:hypothetical protein [Muribaculaceae bacterium]
MRTSTLALIMAMAAGCPASYAAIDIMPLPDQVASVSPAQGWVDTSNNANPLGVTEITVNFRTAPEVNPECTSTISIYVDGSDVAAESLVANEVAYIDAMGVPAGGFSFTKRFTAPGLYHVSIPAGVWLLDGEASPALELNYGIRQLQTLSPAAGIYDELSTITLTVAGTNVRQNDAPELFSGLDDYDMTISIEEGTDSSVITMTIGEPINTPGTYTLLIPGGTFTYDMEEDGKIVTIDSQEIVATYYISAVPKPAIDPEEGTVKGFDKFTLTMPEGYSMFFADTMSISYIYPVLPDGSLSPSYEYRVRVAEYDSEAGTVQLVVLNSDNMPTETLLSPANGEYALRLANSLVSGTYNDEFVGTAPFIYYYTVNNITGIENIGLTENETLDVYTITGVRVGHNLNRESLKTLPTGLYIVNGKKIMVH